MDENESANLDLEFKRYLHILRPYLGQLLEQEDIEICNSWIRRLADCKENEKYLRNKYLLILCYQLAKGVLNEPFDKNPPLEKLPCLSDELYSDDSSANMDIFLTDSDNSNVEIDNGTKTIEPGIKIIDNKIRSKKYGFYESQNKSHNFSKYNNQKIRTVGENVASTFDQSLVNDVNTGVFNDLTDFVNASDNIYHRTQNLVAKLREIKKQNTLLRNELEVLKSESKTKHDLCSTSNASLIKVHAATSTYIHTCASNTTINSINCNCKQMIAELQNKLINLNEIKKLEIEDLKAEHRIEIVKMQTSIRDEVRDIYEQKLQSTINQCEDKIKEIQNRYKTEIENMKAFKNENISEKDNQILSKNVEINKLHSEISDLKSQNIYLRKGFDTIDYSCSFETSKMKARELEKRLHKIEKSKYKRTRAYEERIANLQREKHLAEYSLQLHLIKHRSEIISEFAEENQSEISTAIEKLESKYKEIVANVQAAAIQRRIQDQMALESIIQVVFKNQKTNYANCSQGNHDNLNENHHVYDDEVSLLQNINTDRIAKKDLYSAKNDIAGFCFDNSKLRELFEKMYVPQRDTDNNPIKN